MFGDKANFLKLTSVSLRACECGTMYSYTGWVQRGRQTFFFFFLEDKCDRKVSDEKIHPLIELSPYYLYGHFWSHY